MKYIGILNFINQIICMIICVVIIILAMFNNNELYFYSSLVAVPLLLWNIAVFTNRMLKSFK